MDGHASAITLYLYFIHTYTYITLYILIIHTYALYFTLQLCFGQSRMIVALQSNNRYKKAYSHYDNILNVGTFDNLHAQYLNVFGDIIQIKLVVYQ